MSIAIKILGGQSVKTIEQTQALEFCFCGRDCYDAYTEKAFTSTSSDAWKSDKASFIFSKIINADSINFEIWKSGSKVADVVDSSFGTYYPSFSNQPLYTAFIADWTAISTAFGHGIYTIRATRTILGQDLPFTSRKYWVMPYDEELADETVRIETYTTQNIIRNDIDFRDLIEGGWYQSIRVHGIFGRQTPTFVEDQYQNSDRQIKQINPSIEYEWFLETHYLPEGVKNQIVDNQTLANRTVITDYNLLNDGIYREKELSFNDFDTVEHAGRGTKYVLKWKDKKNDLRLRF